MHAESSSDSGKWSQGPFAYQDFLTPLHLQAGATYGSEVLLVCYGIHF